MMRLPTPEAIQDAVRLLQAGELVGLPTETVYGLAADATQDLAVAKIFEKKNRPSINPLIIHGASQECFRNHVMWNDKAQVLAEAFWPGPLTLVLPRKASSSLSLLASAGLETIAVRIPNHPVARALLEKLGKPLAAPSANRSGKMSPTSATHVEEDFPDLFILEGREAPIGLESTIVDLSNAVPTLLRPGGIPLEDIERLLGPLSAFSGTHLKAPGMMKSHYAPCLPLRLNAEFPREGEAFLAFGPCTVQGEAIANLSKTGDLREAAANFFKMLRLLDHPLYQGIAVAPLPKCGLGLALNDRLERAAAPPDL